MEQTIQKPSLPIKTKIAAWWMIIIGGIVIGFIIKSNNWLIYLFDYFLYPEKRGVESGWLLVFGLILIIFFLLPIFLCFILPGLFLLRKKRWAWWISNGTMILFVVFVILFSYIRIPFLKAPPIFPKSSIIIASLLASLPFLLLLLDRKNFWKIAT